MVSHSPDAMAHFSLPKQAQSGGDGAKAARCLRAVSPCAPASGAHVLPAPPASPQVELMWPPPSSSPNRDKNWADAEANLSVARVTGMIAKELPKLPRHKNWRRRSMPHLSQCGHAEAGDVGVGNRSQLLGRLRQHVCAKMQFHEPACSEQRRTIHACPRFEDYYQLISDVMPSTHCGMEIKKAIELHSKEEKVVKVRWKENSFRDGGEEKAWRASTEMMLNLPPCRGIARVQQVLETPDAYLVVMEKAGGKDLCEHFKSEGPFPIEEVRDVLRQLLTAVGELHSRGCIHKDLKLENVMLDRTLSASVGSWSMVPSQDISPSSGTSPKSGGGNSLTAWQSIVKLIDFDTIEEWSPKSTKASVVLGTDQYIAPEAYEGNYTPASDIFAVGVLVYKLLSGFFPFPCAIFNDRPGENWVGSPKMRQIRDRLHEVRIDWRHPVFLANPGAQQILDKMLAMNMARRPSAREALADPWLAVNQRTLVSL